MVVMKVVPSVIQEDRLTTRSSFHQSESHDPSMDIEDQGHPCDLASCFWTKEEEIDDRLVWQALSLSCDQISEKKEQKRGKR